MLEIGSALPDEGQAEKGSMLWEAPKALLGGITSATGSAISGAAGQKAATRFEEDVIPAITKRVLGEMGLKAGDPFKTPEQLDTFRKRVREEINKAPIEDFTATGTYQAGKAVKDWAAETFKPAKDYENSLTADFMGRSVRACP